MLGTILSCFTHINLFNPYDNGFCTIHTHFIYEEIKAQRVTQFVNVELVFEPRWSAFMHTALFILAYKERVYFDYFIDLLSAL